MRPFNLTEDEIYSAIRRNLEQLGANPKKYKLGNEVAEDGQYKLQKFESEWHVFSIERGGKFENSRFDSVMDAASYFLCIVFMNDERFNIPKVDWTI